MPSSPVASLLRATGLSVKRAASQTHAHDPQPPVRGESRSELVRSLALYLSVVAYSCTRVFYQAITLRRPGQTVGKTETSPRIIAQASRLYKKLYFASKVSLSVLGSSYFLTTTFVSEVVRLFRHYRSTQASVSHLLPFLLLLSLSLSSSLSLTSQY